ncbi:hypothetical protein AYO20_01291 [Fonsecaea nubica]|uniref:Uncharacterized protein n=1 Tax=Fonsecaea nubica TaxID=856822 RepID=A0A178DDX2_9EURO|nr:hypothetical protein AYO20_01291 [Fonsecaea nubica]OAL39421.1 hypothetical protein AYO20_01291 [Fonsecaea nubica]
MSSRFENRVVFVTGGTSGLGEETCKLFAAEGAQVFITDLEERSICSRVGPNTSFYPCDVGDLSQCEKAVAACVDKYGRIDVLFHNAGRFAPLATVPRHDIDLFKDVINIDLISGFYLGRLVIPIMQKQGKGAIVITSSTTGLGGDFGVPAYATAKAGIANLARCMALDHAHEGIRVNVVCPGYMITPMTSGFRQMPEAEKFLVDSIPMKRGAKPIEAARVVLFLASDEASTCGRRRVDLWFGVAEHGSMARLTD